MLNKPNSLKVYIHYDVGDQETVLALFVRLSQNGIHVFLPENAQTPEELQKIVHESHVVIFCVSKQFNRAESHRKETQSAFETALEKRRGGVLLLPVRLEDCNMPARLRRWQPVDLFENNGYERLMLALKMRAEMVGASLTVRADWSNSFFEYKTAIEDVAEKRTKQQQPRLGWLAGVILILLVASGIFFWSRYSTPPASTPDPVEVLAKNATQNSADYATNRAATVTADAFTFSDPLTQTASYKTGVPLTQTAELFTLTPTNTPTPTYTPTLTLTPRTLAVLPTEIMDMNNIPMVLVPESGFRMGSDDSGENVKPETVIYLLSYYIDKYEVTNGIYQPCVDAGVCQPPKSSASQTRPAYYDDPQYKDYPVINVDWQMAKNFCEWRGARLPTEAEWEKASRGTDARVYPWGDGLGCSFANYRDGSTLCVGDTSQVGQYENGKSIYGVFDMSGNVLEWVSSLYFPYPYNSLDGREDLSTTGKHILRGGSWQFSADGISAFYRLSVDPSQYAVAGNDVGFRCAREANP